ncbi:GNAT family N-acetyltransferase [Cognatishimia activa]|uniref:GNAT family N-acetyltransferase n=1 Tax=Cognatishimia activa TaxID=1715691 RepID=A0A975I8C2_9RHOB|nr:GNAT family N-acetyltransferase [Cognatishimia activa]QTN36864.1 GNAT family N-acetyltransferase [Cognatishimia activa]
MMEVRRPTQEDVPAIAAIINAWIDETPWMDRDVPPEEIEAMIGKGLPHREMWVLGDPVQAYLSCEAEANHIWGFYCATPGLGHGKRLMNKVKEGRDFLSLNTHVPNTGAQRFYKREGFKPVKEFDPDPPSTIRELRMEWTR